MTSQLRRHTALLVASILGAFLSTRAYLHVVPEGGGVSLFGTHVHHLLTGIILVVIGGVPAILTRPDARMAAASVCVFGFGLGLALDEWALTLVRETNPGTLYESPVSLAGALASVSLAAVYTFLVYRIAMRSQRRETGRAAVPSDRIDAANSKELP